MKSLQIVGNARYGGATYLMLEWSKYLIKKGVQVDIVCTDEIMVSKAREIPDIQVIDDIYIPREIRPGIDGKAFIQLCSLMRKNRYDVLHTYTAVPSFLGRFSAVLTQLPVSVNHQGGWSVGDDSSWVERAFFTPLEYISTLACTRNICVSHAEKAKALQFGLAPEHKLVTIVNGLDSEPFVTARKKRDRAGFLSALGVPENHIVLGSTGRLVSGKGNDTLIKAIDILNRSRSQNEPPFTLLIAGDGVDRPILEDLIQSLELGDRVNLLGFWDEIPEFLANIDIFVTPSLSEGLSISLLEAMAAACPIISSDIPPNAEVIGSDEVCGLLVPVNSPESIANAALRITQTENLAESMAQHAQQRALSFFSLKRMFDETWDLYCDLLKEKGREIQELTKQPSI